MPKTKLGEHVKLLKNPRQPVKELIVGRFDTCNIQVEELAAAMGVKRATAYRRLNQPVEEWTYGEIIGACRLLSITTEELRERIRV